MKKAITILAILSVLLSLCCACTQNVHITEKDCVILKAVNMNYGQVNNKEDYWASTTYTLTSTGKLERVTSYNLSGNTVETCTITQDELIEIIAILDSQKNAKEDHDAMDGDAWDITYYNEDGKEISHYNGYIYNNKKLQQMAELLSDQF